jgi:hypothetical protein
MDIVKSFIHPKGVYKVKYFDHATGQRWEEQYENTYTAGFVQAVFKFLTESVSNPDCDALDITHTGLGTGTTAPTKNDTTLQTEYARKSVGYRAYTATKLTCETSFAASEGNPTGEYIKEVGTFCKASDTPGSGLMISRCAANIYKTASVSIIIVWELTFN